MDYKPMHHSGLNGEAIPTSPFMPSSVPHNWSKKQPEARFHRRLKIYIRFRLKTIVLKLAITILTGWQANTSHRKWSGKFCTTLKLKWLPTTERFYSLQFQAFGSTSSAKRILLKRFWEYTDSIALRFLRMSGHHSHLPINRIEMNLETWFRTSW